MLGKVHLLECVANDLYRSDPIPFAERDNRGDEHQAPLEPEEGLFRQAGLASTHFLLAIEHLQVWEPKRSTALESR